MTRDLAEHYNRTMRRDAIVPGLMREAGPCTVRYTQARGSVRFVLWHHFAAADVERVVADEIALARARVQALIWRVHAEDEPRELGAHLRSVGFSHDTTWQHFAPPQRVIDSTRDHGCAFDIRELETAQQLEAYLGIWNDAWPDEPNERWVRDHQRLLDEGEAGIRFWAAFDGAQAVASAYLVHPPGIDFAMLCGGVTRRAWQRHGAYRALLHVRAAAAQAAGAQTLCVDARAPAAPVLQGLGFEPQVEVAFYELTFARGD